MAGSALLVILISGLAVWGSRQRPYLLVGWFWYFGLLVPVLGLVQVGVQAMADRYTYLPLAPPIPGESEYGEFRVEHRRGLGQ